MIITLMIVMKWNGRWSKVDGRFEFNCTWRQSLMADGPTYHRLPTLTAVRKSEELCLYLRPSTIGGRLNWDLLLRRHYLLLQSVPCIFVDPNIHRPCIFVDAYFRGPCIFVDPNIHQQMSLPQALGSSQRPDLSTWLGWVRPGTEVLILMY
jgi:hypothetical protein